MYLALLVGLLAPLSIASPQEPAPAVQEWDYYSGNLNEFEVTSAEDGSSYFRSRVWPSADEIRRTRILFDGPGEGYLTWGSNRAAPSQEQLFLALKVPRGSDGGARFVSRHHLHGAIEYQIKWDPITLDDSAVIFYEAKGMRYDRMISQDVAGSAWFRRQADVAWANAARLNDYGSSQWVSRESAFRQPRQMDTPAQEYDLFSSGRAVAENLRLDRVLDTDLKSKRNIDIDSIAELDVEEIDWAPRLVGLKPKLDPTAPWIPMDQYAVFFPSIGVLNATLNEAAKSGAPVLNLLDPRSVDAGTRDFYLRQMCLDSLFQSPGKWAEQIHDVTITGSDPYFRTGTDVTVLLRTDDYRELGELLVKRQLRTGAESFPGTLIKGRDWPFECVRTPDRRICSYVTWGDGMVMVSNSIKQLERVCDALDGTIPNLLAAPEYTYFRHQYPLQADSNGAFLLLTDPTIRRWGSAKWRIGAARRTQAAAVMLHRRAMKIERESSLGTILPNEGLPTVQEYGSWQFLTPILELNIEQVSAQERDQYNRFRDRYQRAWRDAFDPIAATLEIDDASMKLDITIEPLVANSEYWDMLDVSMDAELPPDSGDIHSQAVVQWAMAINKKSEPFRQLSSMSSAMMPGLTANPFQWVGDSLSFYFDDSPFWEELVNADDTDAFISENLHRLPFGLDVAVEDRLRLVAFLAGLRGLIVQVDPGSPPWKTHHHLEVPYVEITMSDSTREFLHDQLRLFYVILPRHLVFSMREEIIHAAIERSQQPSETDLAHREAFPWLGSTFALATNHGALKSASLWMRPRYQDSSWRNIHILNEWRALYPDRDPVAVHAELWGEKLLCPGGGEYLWNEEWQTMESSVYGCPEAGRAELQWPPAIQALQRADFGLTMSGDSLRAKVIIRR